MTAVLVERAGLGHGGLPELDGPIVARAAAARGECRAAREALVVPGQQPHAERIADALVVVEAAVQALDLLGRDEVEEVLVEVRADDLPAPLGEAGVVELLEEGREPGRNDRVEHDLRAARHDRLDRLAVVGVVEREVLLPDDRAAVRAHDAPNALVEHVRPDVVGGRQVEGLRARLLHQPGDEGLDLLRRHRTRAEDERVALLALVLLRVQVELPALGDGRARDRLPGRAVDPAEDHIDAGPRSRAWPPWPRRRHRRSRRPRRRARAAAPAGRQRR